MFSMLFTCPVNVPAFFIWCENVLVPAFPSLPLSLCLVLFLFLSISKAFRLISRSSFFSILSPSASLFNSVGQAHTVCSENKTQHTVTESDPQHCPSVLSDPFLFVPISVSNQMIKLFLSPHLSSPKDPPQWRGVIYHSHGHLGRQVAC